MDVDINSEVAKGGGQFLVNVKTGFLMQSILNLPSSDSAFWREETFIRRREKIL